MSEQPCVKCGGPCKASEPMTHSVYQQIAKNERDRELLARLRSHSSHASFLEVLSTADTGDEHSDYALLLLQLLRGGTGQGG